ncbi:MAG: hypothetical protein ACRYF0_16625 [Janthinobacterium lividum]
MLTPLRVLAGLAILCLLSLLAVILSIESHPAIGYLGVAGYTLGALGLGTLISLDYAGKLPPVLRLPRIQLPKLPELPKGSRVLLLGLAAVGTFIFGPPLVRLVYPSFGGFAPDTINAYTLGAAQYFLALTMAYTGWRALFPRLYDYAAETMEGKLLESITADLLALLAPPTSWPVGLDYILTPERLAQVAERRKIATLQFTTRCARLIFSCSPFFIFFFAANAALTAALTAVPAAALGS